MTDQDLPRGEGCIEGMRCPTCGKFEQFNTLGRIAAPLLPLFVHSGQVQVSSGS